MPRKGKDKNKNEKRKLHRYTIEEDHELAHRQVFNLGWDRTPRGWRRRPAFLLLVKFKKEIRDKRPKKRAKHFAEFFNQVDDTLYRKYGKTRCEMGIHERVTYDLEGDYQLAVLWDAPNREVADKFLKVWLKDKGIMSISPDSAMKADSQTVTGQSRYRR